MKQHELIILCNSEKNVNYLEDDKINGRDSNHKNVICVNKKQDKDNIHLTVVLNS